MTQRLRAVNIAVSLDGFGTGEGLSEAEPFGHAGSRLHEWMFATRTGAAMLGDEGGSRGVEDAVVSRWGAGFGTEIMGRLKFHTGTGPIPDDWRGPWGPTPPYRTPVFVLTHHPRPPLEMDGGTTFHFVDAAPAEALAIARDAAGGLDVRLGGGMRTIREFLDADLVDDLHLAVVPIVLGRGQRIWDGQEGLEERFDVESFTAPSGITHLNLTRRPRQ